LNNIFSENITWAIGIIVILFGIIATHRLVLHREKRNKFSAEAANFRSKVLAELHGIYPIPSVWLPQDYSHFRQSINKVETTAAEFRHFVKRKAEFDVAMKEYREYCEKVTFEGVSAWFTYTSWRSPDDIGPVETFKNIVEHLLSFADEK
jgi:hypothetical protein